MESGLRRRWRGEEMEVEVRVESFGGGIVVIGLLKGGEERWRRRFKGMGL